MTLETAALSLAVEVYEVELHILDGREVQSLVNKLQRYGFIKQETYTWSTDKKNRPRRARATFLVYVPREKKKAFRAMLSQTENHTRSQILFRPIL